MNDQSPDYLIIGHVTKDAVPEGSILGGTCSYSGVTAHKLGERVAAVTRAGPDIPSTDIFEGVEVELMSDSCSTTFENRYQGGVREQSLYSVSGSLAIDDVPLKWRSAGIVHLAPMAQEISPVLARLFPDSLVGATLQGWLRGTDRHKKVIYECHPLLEEAIGNIDVVIASEEDFFGNRAELGRILGGAKLGVETTGPNGCVIYHSGESFEVPVETVEEADPTGAGDVFAGAFLVEYRNSRDFIKSAQFANSCASLSVERKGVEGIPYRVEVEKRRNAIYA